jgi:hypothetical protein
MRSIKCNDPDHLLTFGDGNLNLQSYRNTDKHDYGRPWSPHAM